MVNQAKNTGDSISWYQECKVGIIVDSKNELFFFVIAFEHIMKSAIAIKPQHVYTATQMKKLDSV